MSYTQVFGGNTIYPSDVSYLALALSANIDLEWPLETATGVNVAARIIDVTASAAGYFVDMPDATLTGAGQVVLFNNVGATYSFYVRDFSGVTLATIAPGEQWELYLAATTTAGGTWRVFRFGASTATVQPSALAGFGLTTTGSTLSQSTPVTTFNTSPQTLASSNRASAWVWTGTGLGTLNLPAATTVGNNYFVTVRNEGGGDLAIDPAGVETINSLPTVSLRPGDSATLITDGAKWFTIGLGQDAVFAFDFTQISVTGGTYTLSGSELNRIAYKFVGTLTSNLTIIVPSTIQQYWVHNATGPLPTSPYTLSVQTLGGTPVTVNQGARGIYYCDGSNIILADTASISLPIGVTQGGTGGTTQSTARLGIGITAFADPIVTATAGGTVRTTIGAAASGANTDITSLTGLTTALSVAQGGTGQTTYTNGQLLIGNTTGNTLAKTTLTAGSGVTITNGAGSITIAATGTGGTVTSVAALTIGTTGTDLSSTVATGSTTPVITLNVPTASATNRGVLSSANWTTFNNKAASGANTDITSLATATTINGVTIGYRSIPRSTTSGTATTADVGKVIAVSAGITIPNSTFAPGDAVSIYNDSAAAITITAGVTTLRQAGTTNTGNRTLAARGMATVWFNSATEAIISGAGVS